MSTPIQLAVKPPRDAIREGIVKGLEEALDRARRGEFDTLMLVAELSDSEEMYWAVSGSVAMTQTIGRLEYLKQQLILRLMGQAQ